MRQITMPILRIIPITLSILKTVQAVSIVTKQRAVLHLPSKLPIKIRHTSVTTAERQAVRYLVREPAVVPAMLLRPRTTITSPMTAVRPATVILATK